MITYYDKGKELLLNGSIDLVNDEFRILACTPFTINSATQILYSDISSNEITANGYTAGGLVLGTKQVVPNATDHKSYWKFANPTWNPVGSMSAQIFPIVQWNATAGLRYLLCAIDKGTPQTRADAAFILQLNAKGLFGI